MLVSVIVENQCFRKQFGKGNIALFIETQTDMCGLPKYSSALAENDLKNNLSKEIQKCVF